MKEQEKKQETLQYEQPDLEVIEFDLEESIAASSNLGFSTFCGEETY